MLRILELKNLKNTAKYLHSRLIIYILNDFLQRKEFNINFKNLFLLFLLFMKKDIFSTLKHTIIYSIGNVSIKVVGFILLPLYTSYLSVADFGMLGLLEAFLQFSIAVFGFRLSTAMIRWIAGEKDITKQRSIIYTALSTSAMLLIPVVIILLFFKTQLSILFFDTGLFSNYFLILILTIPAELIFLFVVDILRTREKSVLYLIITLLKVITNLSLVIYFVAELNMGVEGIVLSQLISTSFLLLLSLPIFYNNIVFKYNIKIAKEMLSYGFPLIFSTISLMLLTLADRFYLKFFYSLSDVGIYNLSYKIASVVNIVVIQSFQLGFLPLAFKKYEEGEGHVFFVKILKYYSTVLLLSIIVISIFSKEIIMLLSKNSDYYQAYYYVPVIAMSFYIKGIYYIFSLGLHFVKKTKYNSMIVFIGAIVNLILNFLFVPKFGIGGATVASIFASIVLLLLFYYYSQREYRIEYDIKRIFVLTVVGVGFILIGYYFNSFELFLSIGSKLALLLFFPVVLYIFKYFTNDELKEFSSMLKKYKIIK